MQLLLLCWKDWKWQKSHWNSFVLLYVVPALFSSFYALFNGGDYTPHHQEGAIVSHQAPLSLPLEYEPPFHIKIFFPAKAKEIEFEEFHNFCEELCKGYKISLYDGTKSFNRSVKYTAFLIIEEWNVEAPSLKYRYIDFQWKIESLIFPLWGLWSLDQKSQLRRESEAYAAMTQRLIDYHFYRRRECLLKKKICESKRTKGRQLYRGLQEMVVHHAAMPLFNPVTAPVVTVFAQLSTFFALIGIWQVVDQIADERTAKSRLFLEGLRVSRVQYYLSFFIFSYWKLLVMQLVLWIPPNIALKNVFDVNVIYPGILIYSAVLSSFAVLIGSIFHNRLSARLGSFMVILFLHLGQLGQEDQFDIKQNYFLSSLFFTNAYYYYLRASTVRRAIGGFVPDYGIRSLNEVPFLLLSILIMYILAVYFDTVFPGRDGRRGAHWTFPFSLSYWRANSAQPLYEEESFMKDAILVDLVSAANVFSKGLSTDKGKTVKRICALQLEGVCKSIDHIWIVNRVTMKVFYDEITILYGPRGAGGKEILELISCQLSPDHGEIEVKMIDGKKPKVAISKTPCFFPQLTTREFIIWTAKMRGVIKQDTMRWMEELSLKEVAEKRVNQLNIVQHQQLNLLLAFIGETKVILLEEPTINCPPDARNTMHAFILSHKKNRAIIISTYDPLEAEICCNGTIAFLNYGHLVSLGSVNSTREKFVHSMNLVVWPTENFTKYQRLKIEKILNQFLPEKLPRVSWESMPNESIRFFVPCSDAVPIEKIMQQLEKHQIELGINYFEMQRQSMQDAYYNCIRSWEQDSDVDPEVLAIPLEQLYNDSRVSSFWPELTCILQMNFSLVRAHWAIYIFFLMAPITMLPFLSYIVISNHLSEKKLAIGVNILTESLGINAGRIWTNMKLRTNWTESVKETNDGHWVELLAGKLLYKEPPIVAGLVKEDSTGLFHLYTIKLLHFGNLLIQNLFINSVIDAPVARQVVHMSVESQEWLQMPIGKHDGWLPDISNRELANIVFRQWKTILIIGGMLGMLFARAALFVAKMAEKNCLNMLFLSGARPLPFWAAMFTIDLLFFFISLVISFGFLITLAGVGSLGLAITSLLSLLAYVTFLPCVYLVGLQCRDVFSVHSSFFFLIGSLAILPACFCCFVGQYGSTLEEWIDIIIFIALLCPPLAASLGSAVCIDLIELKTRALIEAIKVVYPLIIATCLHIFFWLIIITNNSSTLKRLQSKWQYWWHELSTDPRDFIQVEGTNIVVTNTNFSVSRVAEGSGISVVERAANFDEAVFEVGGRPTTDGRITECTTLTLEAKTRENNRTQQIRNMLPKQSFTCSSTSVEGTNKHKEETTITPNLWDKRDAKSSTAPIISYNSVRLNHYSDGSHVVSFSVLDRQLVYLCGDSPQVRSSLLDMAAGQSFPKSGEVTVKGKMIDRTSKIAYVPADDRLCTFLTGRLTLEMAARLRKYRNIHALVAFILQVTALQNVADHFVYEYSVPDRRMLQFAIAIIDRPTVLLLNELDTWISPTLMKTVWTIVHSLRKALAVPVLFSSSRVGQCEATSSHIVILSHGAISLADTTVEIKKRFSGLAMLTLTLNENMDRENMKNIIMSQLDFDTIYHAHFTNYVETEEQRPG